MKWDGWDDEFQIDAKPSFEGEQKNIAFTSGWLVYIAAAIGAVAKVLHSKIRESHEGLEARIKTLEDQPRVKYLGTWKHGEIYPPGSLVTRKGGLWHANTETDKAPGEGPSDWTLAVKRGAADSSDFLGRP